jgi:hypothetical protein
MDQGWIGTRGKFDKPGLSAAISVARNLGLFCVIRFSVIQLARKEAA